MGNLWVKPVAPILRNDGSEGKSQQYWIIFVGAYSLVRLAVIDSLVHLGQVNGHRFYADRVWVFHTYAAKG